MASVERNQPKKVHLERTKMGVRNLQKENNTLNLQYNEILSRLIEHEKSYLKLENRQLINQLTFAANLEDEFSSSLLNAKRLLGNYNELLYANKTESSGSQYVSPGGLSTRAQAMVNPMVKEVDINGTCFFSEQCENRVLQTECRDGRCACRFEMTPTLNKHKKMECMSNYEPPVQEQYVDPAMIGVLVGMALMFIIICVVLRLFSKARWRDNRTIFNTPNPRLMNVSRLRDNKPPAGERRGSKGAPSRQPSLASLRPQSPAAQSQGSRVSPKGSLRGSRSSSGSAKSPTTNVQHPHPHQHQQPHPPHDVEMLPNIYSASEQTDETRLEASTDNLNSNLVPMNQDDIDDIFNVSGLNCESRSKEITFSPSNSGTGNQINDSELNKDSTLETVYSASEQTDETTVYSASEQTDETTVYSASEQTDETTVYSASEQTDETTVYSASEQTDETTVYSASEQTDETTVYSASEQTDETTVYSASEQTDETTVYSASEQTDETTVYSASEQTDETRLEASTDNLNSNLVPMNQDDIDDIFNVSGLNCESRSKEITFSPSNSGTGNQINDSELNKDSTLEPEITIKQIKSKTSTQENNEPSQASTSNLNSRPRRNVKRPTTYKLQDLRSKLRRC